ncbi:LamG-like jellyroll fold domain-containing protein [Clostridium nigeriense]|uniref:LamG-like jellyroll fold domain-containing protein n=1 Tax=Clostridium nigeriense TaxID=1805470 RepID=UPI003D33E941
MSKKKFINLFLSIALTTTFINPILAVKAETNTKTVNIEDGLIGYWNFDDGQVKNLAGDEDGELVGDHVSIKESSDENLGKSLSFTKGNDSNLKIEDFLNTAQNSYSFSLWYKAGELSTTQHTALLQQDGKGKSLLTLRSNDNKYGSYVYGTDALSAGTIAKESWQNIIITINKDSNKIKYYINGKLDGEYDAGSNKVNELTSLLIGSHKSLTNSNPQQFVGEIDEIRVYDYVIGDTIAKEIYDDVTIDHNITLTINTNNIQREIDRGLFGINHRYAFNGYGSFDPELGKVREDFELLYKDANFGSIRYPGGTISNLFRWKDSIGDKDNRKNQIHGFYSAAQGIEPNFGLDEIGTFATDNNSEIIYVYGLGRGSASDAADLIEYLNAEVGTNPNGGIAWAEVRKENGHSKPYDIRYFEIGNEMNQGGGDGSTSQMYWTQAPGGDSLDRYINGGTVAFTKQEVVEPENWNSSTSNSNGEANQVKYMRYSNTIPGRGSVTNEEYQKESFTAIESDSVEIYVNDKKWDIVSDIKKAGQKDEVEVNYFTGEIKFGDGTNGNIPEVNSKITVSYKVKKDGFTQISKAMRETIDQINKESNTNKEIHIYSSYESQGFINTMNAKGQNDLYDGLTIHPYSGDPGGSGEDFYNKAMKLSETTAYNKVKEYVDIMPEDKVPVISEFGIFRSTNPLVRSQTHALYVAKSIMDYIKLGSPYIQKHCLVDWYSDGADALGPTQQAVIQAVAQNGASGGEGDYKFFSTPSAHVFELYNGMFGSEIVESSFNNMITFGDNVKMFNSLTSKDEYNNIYVALVNFDIEKNQSIKINVNDMDLTGKKVDVKKLSGDSFSAENSLTNPNNVAIESSSFVSDGEDLKVDLDPHSFTIFKINSGEITESNKEELEKLYNANKDKIKEDYTEESWRGFEVALNEAKELLEKESVTQEEVDNALEKLRVAVSELKEKVEIPEVNKDKLGELYNANKDKVEENYTEDSWKDFEVALNNAKEVLDNKKASQSMVEEAINNLDIAVKSLKVKDNDTSKEEDNVDITDKEEESNNELPKTGIIVSSNIMLVLAVLLSSTGIIILGRKKI